MTNDVTVGSLGRMKSLATQMRQLANQFDKMDKETGPRKKKALALEALDVVEIVHEKLKEEAGEE